MNKLVRIGLPIAFQELMLAMVGAADALMLGAVEQNLMSAISLATQIGFIQIMILYSIVAGVSLLGAQYWGRQDIKTMDDIFCIGLRAGELVSVAFFLACEFIPGTLMRIYTNDAELIEIGIRYLRVAGWSYLILGITRCYLTMFKLVEKPMAAAVISTVSVVLNIILNAVFIFGLLGVPAMGEQGAALATVIARIVEAACCIFLSYRKGYIHPSLKGLLTHKWVLIKDYLKAFLPLLGGNMLWTLGFSSYTAFMGHLGEDAIAANAVVTVVRDLVCCLNNGAAIAAGIIVGNSLGMGDFKTAKKDGDRLLIHAFIIGFASTAIVLLVTPALMNSVQLTDGARELLLGMMLIMSVYMIGRAVNTILINGIFDGGGDTLFDFYSLAIVMWGVAVPLAALGTFVFHWPVLVVFACTCLDEVGKIPWVVARYKKYIWMRNLTRNREEIDMA